MGAILKGCDNDEAHYAVAGSRLPQHAAHGFEAKIVLLSGGKNLAAFPGDRFVFRSSSGVGRALPYLLLLPLPFLFPLPSVVLAGSANKENLFRQSRLTAPSLTRLLSAFPVNKHRTIILYGLRKACI